MDDGGQKDLPWSSDSEYVQLAADSSGWRAKARGHLQAEEGRFGEDTAGEKACL